MNTQAPSEVTADPRFALGAREFDAGHFFEAHEFWEELWNELVGEPKRFCQGLIQIAAGYHKAAIGSPSGALKLLERGVRLVAESQWSAEPTIAALVVHVGRDLESLRSGTGLHPGGPPRLASAT